MTTRIHISIPVQQLQASIDFYRQLFGADVSKQRDDYANFRLEQPPIHLALVKSKQVNKEKSIEHFGVELPDHDRLFDWRKRLEKNQITFRDNFDTSCCYAKGDKVWVDDPDGHSWELWVRTGETEQLVSDDQRCCH